MSLLATLGAGCKQPLLCEPLSTCGGDIPFGDWVMDMGHGSCSDDLYTPPPDPRLVQADIPAARTPIPEPALYDWCQQLVTGPGANIVMRPPPFLFAESPPVGNATLHYDPAGTYRLTTTRSGTFVINYPPYCMRAFGAMNKGAVNVCDQLTVGLPLKVNPKKYRHILCQPDSNDPLTSGCDCRFDLSDVQESQGSFGLKGSHTLLHRPGVNFPEEALYCNTANTRLQLSAADGEYLFDRIGLRTMDLVKTTAINCDDGAQGIGEDGIDCGAGCEIMCSVINCGDLMQGPGEEGVDCGRRCGKACLPPAP
jgi:hypothetical protein